MMKPNSNGKILLQRPKNDDYAIIGRHVAIINTIINADFQTGGHSLIW